MNKILIITPIYPANDIPKSDTPVVHYFTREWVRMGYDVRVIHIVANFPKFLYIFAKPFREVIGAKVGFGIRTKPYQDCEYILEGVYVKRIALRKFKPHGLHPLKDVNEAIDKIVSDCIKNEYIPSIVIGHYPNPILQILKSLKELWSMPTCYVAHGFNEVDVYGKQSFKLLENVDIIGFRSQFIKKRFLDKYKVDKPTFQCYSGIPSSFLMNNINKDLSDIRRFVYVGTLVKRKHPDSIIPALKMVYGNDCFTLTYVGSGAEAKTIRKVAFKNEVIDNVRLFGHITREEVIKKIDESQVFVMISRNETFGLVYLEAMSRGCITIASREEGFDGIIQDGINGFLCRAGDSMELAVIIKKIREMSINERHIISMNAMITASKLTDVNAARLYIESVIGVV